MSAHKIMIVDDDVNISELIRLYLDKEGFATVCAPNGKIALEKFKNEVPALIILDIMMPEMDGWQVCREIRKTSDVPIIMLTAKGETFDKVLGLELGADDYIVKPFEPKELLARIKAVLRRSDIKSAAESAAENEICFDGLRINQSTYEVYLDDEKVEMPPKEFELLYFLAKKDYETMYIERYWIFPSVGLLIFGYSYVPMFNRICTCLFFLIVSGTIKFIKPNWIGSADVCFLAFFGFYLGVERMLIALYISVFLGFLWILYRKKHILPYLSCLSIGVWIAYMKGYTLFYFLMNLFS